MSFPLWLAGAFRSQKGRHGQKAGAAGRGAFRPVSNQDYNRIHEKKRTGTGSGTVKMTVDKGERNPRKREDLSAF